MNLSFLGKPDNYACIDSVVSRSAQPQRDDFLWLKQQGVTDVINFRTMKVSGLDFDEKQVAEKLGLKYHNIPSYTRHPNKENIDTFLKIIDEVAANNGKVHIHCKAGVDRTGMYSFIYETVKNIGSMQENIKNWINMGHHKNLYPKLIPWTVEFVKNLKK